MTHTEKKSLYESIMKTVAKVVKKHINEMSPEIYRRAADKRQAQFDALPSYLKRKISKKNLNAPKDLRDHADYIEQQNKIKAEKYAAEHKDEDIKRTDEIYNTFDDKN